MPRLRHLPARPWPLPRSAAVASARAPLHFRPCHARARDARPRPRAEAPPPFKGAAHRPPRTRASWRQAAPRPLPLAPGPVTQTEPPPDPAVDDGTPVSQVFSALALWPWRSQGTWLDAEPGLQPGSRGTGPQGHPGTHSAKAPRRVGMAPFLGRAHRALRPATALPRTSASPFAKEEPWPIPRDPDDLSYPSVQGVRKDRRERAALRLRCVLIHRGNDRAASPSWEGRVPRWGPRAGGGDALRSSSLSQGGLEETRRKNEPGARPPRRRDQSRQAGFWVQVLCTPLSAPRQRAASRGAPAWSRPPSLSCRKNVVTSALVPNSPRVAGCKPSILYEVAEQ